MDYAGIGLYGSAGLPFFTFSELHKIRGDHGLRASIVPDNFPSQDIQSVREVVGAAHSNLDRVKELVTARPALAKAVYDWGFGDWESALGAASHMGRRDIAEFLIEYGARPNIYTYVMLGDLNAVKSMVEAIPGVQQINGPHGITLLQHAKNRLRWDNLEDTDRTNVKEVQFYLESLGDADQRDPSLEITEEEKQKYLGTYIFGEGEDEYFTVTFNRQGNLFLSRGEAIGRVLLRVEEHGFAPGGAPAVRVRFEPGNEGMVSLTVYDPDPLVVARRKDS